MKKEYPGNPKKAQDIQGFIEEACGTERKNSRRPPLLKGHVRHRLGVYKGQGV